MTALQIEKRKRHICTIANCSRKAAIHHIEESRIYYKSLCPRHEKRKQKENNPTCYFFHNLKSHAKARGKEFLLTLEEFRKFCRQTGYLIKEGIDGSKFHIDRINPLRGYAPDNIQLLPGSLNIRKQYAFDKYMMRTGAGLSDRTIKAKAKQFIQQLQEAPF